MDSRVQAVTRTVQSYDRELFARRDHDHVIRVYRKSRRYLAYEFSGNTLLYAVDSPHLIFSLTEDWSPKGRPVEWGLEPVLHRLRFGDLWNRSQFVDEYLENQDRIKKSNERGLKNNLEAMASDYRRFVAKTFNDYNVASIKKDDPRKIEERKKWQ